MNNAYTTHFTYRQQATHIINFFSMLLALTLIQFTLYEVGVARNNKKVNLKKKSFISITSFQYEFFFMIEI